MSKKYLNVVSAGVMAFGTLALGLVTVLPMAGAANAVEDKGLGMYHQTFYGTNGKEEVNYDGLEDHVDTDDDSNATYNSTFYKQTSFEEGDKTEPDKTEPAKTDPAKTDPKTDPKGAEEKGGKTPVTPATPKNKESDRKSADKGTTKGADQGTDQKGQQHVKKGHHKFGAPNTGYEF